MMDGIISFMSPLIFPRNRKVLTLCLLCVSYRGGDQSRNVFFGRNYGGCKH